MSTCSVKKALLLCSALLVFFSVPGISQADYRITEEQMQALQTALTQSNSQIETLKALTAKQSSQIATLKEQQTKSAELMKKSDQQLTEQQTLIATLKKSLTKSKSSPSRHLKAGLNVMDSKAYPSVGYQAGKAEVLLSFDHDGLYGGAFMYTVLEW